MSFTQGTLIFLIYTDISKGAETIVPSYIVHACQASFTFAVIVAIAHFRSAWAAHRTVVIVSRNKGAVVISSDTDIYIPPVIKTTAQILATDQAFGAVLIRIAVSLLFATRSTQFTVIIVARFNRT
jgi:hypothetical protein